ncbi:MULTISPECIES: hypothetical protein [Streptomyces]|uniref:Uncharacterized protein n=1 Tax=Streptomyces ortus TaxID=2867268 RepID=A0ABT3UX95_9ACTN|nr:MULTISPECIES: hypothetical protein [Streptomyces]MCX4232181.1 hypothetical protein [Streptomyces ortus]
MTIPHARGATAGPQGPHLFTGPGRRAAEPGAAFAGHAAKTPGRTVPVHANARSAHAVRKEPSG